MSRSTEIAREQELVSRLYERLDLLRRQTRDRLEETRRRGASGTHQARSERDAFAAMYEDRLAQLEAVEPGLCFGRLDLAPQDHNGTERLHIGRIGLTDDHLDTMLVDWRAPAAEPFYRATPTDPHGVVRRRHLRTRNRAVLDIEDDVFDIDDLSDADRETLGGGGALLAALNETRTGRMRDIVATIQAEQDRVIRSSPDGVLIVQGGPGTGKTAVALHRAAYLLYANRERLSRSGVLVVGPGPAFVRYIEQVLPSLGETGVLLSTLEGLVADADVKGQDSLEVAAVKADRRMAGVIENAVAQQQRVPDEVVAVPFEDLELVLTPNDIAGARARVRRSPRTHNRARYAFAKQLLRLLVGRVAEVDPDLARDRWVVRSIMGSEEFKALVDRCWPRLSPTALIESLFTAAGIEAAAGDLLSPAERALLIRAPGSPWTATDMPLLDEARAHLGDPEAMLRVAAERRQARADREFAERVVSSATNAMGIQVDARVMTDRFASGPGSMAVAERAATDPDWEFGHIIVDEAQELSPMAWRMLARRCPLRSMTIVGDIAQAGASWGARSWGAMLQPVAPDRWRVAELTVNYRTPSEIMAVAGDVLAAVDPAAEVPSSVRDAGFPPYAHRVPDGTDRAAYVATVIGQARAAVPDGKLAVITPTDYYGDIVAAVVAAYPGEVGTGAAGLDTAIAILTVTEAKGLEFDAVVLVEPGDWLETGERGLRNLYVALTRATQRLDVVSADALPTVLAGLAPVG